MSLYYDDDILRKDLLDKEALAAADSFLFLTDNDGKRNKKKDPLTSAQLRRFYGEFKTLEKKFRHTVRKPEDKEPEFRKILPLVKMVKSKVEYSLGTKKVPIDFAKWMKKHVNAINGYEDFEAFLLHFEAVVGFCYGLGMKES